MITQNKKIGQSLSTTKSQVGELFSRDCLKLQNRIESIKELKVKFTAASLRLQPEAGTKEKMFQQAS